MRLSWYRGPDDGWAFDGEDRRKWEIICEQCGDTDGPADLQSLEVQLLRGPYKNKRKAKSAEIDHFSDN
jgi:hypothetical protein